MIKIYETKKVRNYVIELVGLDRDSKRTRNDFPEIKKELNLHISKHTVFEQY